jgi:hypothetical protein
MFFNVNVSLDIYGIIFLIHAPSFALLPAFNAIPSPSA